jgi:hypothetical protein
MAKAARDVIQTDKDQRLFAFFNTNKSPGVCFRFAYALDTLLAQKLSRIQRIEEELKKDLVYAPTPRKVWERYLLPALRESSMDEHRRAEIKRVARLFCRYLNSILEERMRFLQQEREKWDEFI